MRKKLFHSLVTTLIIALSGLSFSISVLAKETSVETPDETIYYGNTSVAYMNNESKGICLAGYILDDNMGIAKTQEEWERWNSDAPVYEGFYYTGVAAELNMYYGIHDLAIKYADGDHTTTEILAAEGLSIAETTAGISHLRHYQKQSCKSANHLLEQGVKIADAMSDFVHIFTDVLFPSDDLYRIDNVDEKTNEAFKQDVVYFVKAGDATIGQKASISTQKPKSDSSANATKPANSASKESTAKSKTENNVNDGISAEGNGGSVDHSDGISEEELIQELMYLDSLGLSDDEYNRQLEEWAAQHGAN